MMPEPTDFNKNERYVSHFLLITCDSTLDPHFFVGQIFEISVYYYPHFIVKFLPKMLNHLIKNHCTKF